ncbi:MAG: hypothetical protein HQL63_07515 [Magnetococcales bacterium]|nr:hypothetical protein [Magnetococcales bacterium]MBF0322681.1 hypothetical protein [Magnetococcales bacterium]
MKHDEKPLIKNPMVLIFVGAIAIMLFTLFGVSNNPGEVIREDVSLGPIIAASRVLIPLFATLGLIYFLSTVKKCDVCGRILFWRQKKAP